jgi:hypothetical protein
LRILFVTEKRINAGSIQAIAAYIAAGDKLGHTIAVYGCPDPAFPKLRFSMNAGEFDFVVFILESKLDWLSGLRLARILSHVPRERRAVLDADGLYNDLVFIGESDRNHTSSFERDRWGEACDQLGSRIFQPTNHPHDSRVKPLLFYGYSPEAEVHPSHRVPKIFDVVHVCHNWWRWNQLEEYFFPVISQIRERIGDICFLGLWWDACPPWAGALGLAEAFRVDAERLKKLRITVRPPVPFTQVIPAMSTAKINIMTQRPLFQRLGIITSKYFEIFCADTIPLVMIAPELAESVYGRAGRDLAMNGDLEHKLLGALESPERYQDSVMRVRKHLKTHHSYETRLRQLVAALES